MEGKYDKNKLEKRLKAFSITILVFLKTLPYTDENSIFKKQIIRSSSSIGANYAEAIFAQSKQEFIHCLKIARKEANETLYWLDLISEANSLKTEPINLIIDENKQILRILISSIKTLMNRK